MSTLIRDVRYGIRRLLKSPGFTSVTVLTLALGIGANTAIFTLVDAVMLRPLPVKDPAQLYRIGDAGNCCVVSGFQGNWSIYSYALYQNFRDHTPEFSGMAAFQGGLPDISARRSGSTGPAEPFIGQFVSGNFFEVFGVGPYAGRVLSPGDDRPGAAPVAVLNYNTWQRHFGGDPSIIGATFNINLVPYTIAGVAAPEFFGATIRPDPPDFWLPLSTEPALNGANSNLNREGDHWLYIVGRLNPGISPATLSPKLTVQLQQWLNVLPDLTEHDRVNLPKQHIQLASSFNGVRGVQEDAGAGLRVLMAISGLVLIIACANIANLLLARGAAQRSETAIRMALGAARSRLVRQVLTESVLLAVLGGLAGLFVAFASTSAILLLAFRGAHVVPISPAPSLPVLGFAFALSLLTGIVFGVAPAWITSRSDPAEALRGAGRASRDRSGLPQKSLVVLQVALSTVLLIGAGLLTQSLRNLENQPFGFQTDGRVVLRVDPSLAGYTPERLYSLYQQLGQRLPQIPGVLSASFSLYSPMRDDNWSSSIHVEGRPPEERDGASWDRVSAHYFETIGTRLLRGRAIDDRDTPASPRVAVINQAFVKKFFPDQDPIGKHFGFRHEDHGENFEIVGLVEDAKYVEAREPAYATFFLPFLQVSHDPDLSWQVRSHYFGDIELHVAGRPQNLEPDVRRTLAGIDPNLTVLDMMTMGEQLSRNFNQERLVARLTDLFSLLALLLACLGLYGVTAYSVVRRTGEFGIRMAIGANRANVIGLVLRGALLQLALGLATGIPVALAAGRLLASQLYGVKSNDPAILAVATAILAACTLVAGFVPARRAASIDPIQALRVE